MIVAENTTNNTLFQFGIYTVNNSEISNAITVSCPMFALQFLDVGTVQWVGSQAWIDSAKLVRNRLGQPWKVVHETLRELDLARVVH